MAKDRTVNLMDRLRRAVLAEGKADRTDGQLLEDYLSRRDEAAMTVLVRRHGPMVWGVCRRVLHNHHDAQDAFQASFLVLVRKAASVVPRAMVGNWLYGVAHQTALKARATAARRQARERQVKDMPEPAARPEPDLWDDLEPLLDQELSRLPEKYRAAVVLCDLEGKTRKEAARQLQIPEGTLSTRLRTARTMLAKRLARHGLAVSGGALAAMLSQKAASAGVPALVASSTIKVANLVAAGQAAGAVSVNVAALTEGVVKTMLMTKLKSMMAILLVAALVGLVGYGIARGKGDAAQKQESEKAQKDAIVNERAEKEDAIAWGKEVDGLQAGLVAEAATCRPGDKLKFAVKLRNVGKADIKITHGLLRECPPEVTTDAGGRVSVYMPPLLGIIVVPIEQVIKPRETITLYNPDVAVETQYQEPHTGPKTEVGTPTIRVAPGKYKIAYEGMIQSHPKLSTGTVEFEVKDQVAWGKEVDAVQVGIQLGEDRVYKVGETVTLTVRLRNNAKNDVPFNYDSEYFQKNPPLITDADGKAAKIKERNIFGIIKKGSVAPGKEADLCRLTLDLRPDADRKKEDDWTLYGTGKFYIQYKDVPVVGDPRLDVPVTTYATGKLELEVKEADDKKPVEPEAKQQKDKEAFTEWGKEVSGLQAGLGFGPGEKRPYTHGETVNLVVRVRNVSKEDVKFQYLKEFFSETSLAVTDSKGKQVLLREPLDTHVLHIPVEVNLAPGKEIELYERMLVLSPEYGTGTVQIQYGQVFGNSSFGRIKLDPMLSKLATGKLELEVKDAAPSDKDDDLKKTLLDLDERWWKADADALDKLAADDLITVSGVGRYDKASLLLASRDRHAVDWTRRDVEVSRVSKDVAIVTYVYDCKIVRRDGTPVQTCRDRRSSMTWVKRDGGWVVVFSQETILPGGE